MAKPMTKAFDWPFNHIWQADAKEKLKIMVKNCTFNKWLMTSKSGDVIKRKEISAKSINDKFNHISPEGPICLIRRTDGVTVLERNTFGPFIENYQISLNGVTALQAYTGAVSGTNKIYYNEYFIVDDFGKIVTNTLKTNKFELVEDQTERQTKRSLNMSLNDKLDETTKRIVTFIETNSHCRIVGMICEYLLDDSDNIWLTWIYKCQILKGNPGSDLRLAAVHHVTVSKTPRAPNYHPLNYHLNLEADPTALQETMLHSTSRIEGRKLDTKSKSTTALDSYSRSGNYSNNNNNSNSISPNNQNPITKDLFRVQMNEQNKEKTKEGKKKKKTVPSLQTCCGDFCDFECQDPISLTPITNNPLEIARELLTPEEFEELRGKLNSLDTAVNTGITTDEFYNLTYRSVALARKEGRLVHRPPSPIRSRSYMSDTESRSIKKEYNKKLGEIEGGAANYYRPIIVCARCFKVYSTLDKARELLAGIRKDKKARMERDSNNNNLYIDEDNDMCGRDDLFNNSNTISSTTTTNNNMVNEGDMTLKSINSNSNNITPPTQSAPTSPTTMGNGKNQQQSIPTSPIERCKTATGTTTTTATTSTRTSKTTKLPDINQRMNNNNRENMSDEDIIRTSQNLNDLKKFETEPIGNYSDMDSYLKGDKKKLPSAIRPANKNQRYIIENNEALYQGSVLLVENDKPMVQAIRNIIESEDYYINVVTDGPQALISHRKTPFDLIICEKELPTLGCMELSRIIREKESNSTSRNPIKRVSIIIVTDETSQKNIDEYIDIGIDGCISKPINRNSILNTVKAAIPDHKKKLELEDNDRVCSTSGGKPGKADLSKIPTVKQRYMQMTAPANMSRNFTSDEIATTGIRTHQSRPDPHLSKTLKNLLGDKRQQDDCIYSLFKIDEYTSIPYCVLGHREENSPLFHFVVINDVFDTYERMEIFFKPLVVKYPGLQFLLFNYPGQGYTKFNKDAILNNKYLSECIYKLICSVDISGTCEFITTKSPFYILGFGYGGNIATTLAQLHPIPSIRGLLLLNSMYVIDENITSILHDSLNVFKCSPESRPDLPIYFFSRFLFSNEYLKKVSAPLALNIYTAVHNPISIKARVSLCEGILASSNQLDNLSSLNLPVIVIQSNSDAFVLPNQVDLLIERRGNEVKTINQCINGKQRTCIVWLNSGHEVFQECKNTVFSLVEQLATGYHEKHDVTFLPLGSADELANSDHNRGSNYNTNKNSNIYQPQYSQKQKKNKNELYEDHVINTIINSVKTVKKNNGNTLVKKPDSSMSYIKEDPVTKEKRMKYLEEKEEIERQKQYQKDLINQIQTRNTGNSLEVANGTKTKRRTKTKKNLNDSRLTFDPTKTGFERRDNQVYSPQPGNKIYPSDMPEVREYMEWRIRRNEMKLSQLNYAATTIQRYYRGYIGRKAVLKMKEQNSCLVIQRVFRGHLGRKKFKYMKDIVRMAFLIQRIWRGYLARSKAKSLDKNHKCAIVIQRVFRGYLGRKYVKNMKQHRIDCVTLIQRVYRGRLSRKFVSYLKFKKLCAVTIQRVYRGHLSRKKFRAEREQLLFTKSQNEGIEFGRQMLIEHKLQATKLQSEVALLTEEKSKTEEDINKILKDIEEFEENVKSLESKLLELNNVENESKDAIDTNTKANIAEEKLKLDKEFANLLGELDEKREELKVLQNKLSITDRTKAEKETELKELEKKLVALLEDQQNQLSAIREKQTQQIKNQKSLTLGGVNISSGNNRTNKSLSRVLSSRPSTGKSNYNPYQTQGNGGGNTDRLIVEYRGANPEQRQQSHQLLQTSEAMMKFGFMAMSMTYLSSMNMMKAIHGNGLLTSELDSATLNPPSNEPPQIMTINPTPSSSATTTQARVQTSGTGKRPPLAPTQTQTTTTLNATQSSQQPTDQQSQSQSQPVSSSAGVNERPKTEKPNVRSWSINDVGKWLDEISLGQYKNAFADSSVDGLLLYDLTEYDLLNTMGIKHPLHRKKILNTIARMRKEEENEVLNMLQPQMMMISQANNNNNNMMMMMPNGTVAAAQLPMNTTIIGNSSTTMTSQMQEQLKQEQETKNHNEISLKFNELVKLIQIGKSAKLKEALSCLPDKKFDPKTIDMQYIPDFGTKYTREVFAQGWHINKSDEAGNTLIHYAAQYGSLLCSQLLWNKGINLNHQNKNGQTALHYAVSKGYLDLASWLTDPCRGSPADDTLLNKYGLGPYDGLEPE